MDIPQILVNNEKPLEPYSNEFAFSISSAESISASAELNYLEKSELLYRLKWEHQSDNCFAYIEGYQYERLRHCAPNINFKTGHFSEQELLDWHKREGKFNQPSIENEWGRQIGGFRLLFCERSLGSPPCIRCSRSRFLKIHQSFDLAPETVPSLVQLLGSFGKHWMIKVQDSERIQIIIKAFQKGELGNWTLSLNHNFETSCTDALVVWTGWTSRGHIALDRHWRTRFDHIAAQLQAVAGLWAHPTCLPLVFMQNYTGRTMYRCNMINQELVELDSELGVNQAGRLRGRVGLEADWPANLDFKKLTIGLHSANNQLVFVQQAANWARRCLDFLIHLENELEAKTVPTSTLCASIRESLAYEISMIQGVEDSFDALKARAQGATNVLFNASTQNDSMLNVKIAASTKEDSISMKTFTFLTALFLPGTFIATFLSVTMIDWLPNGNGSTTGSLRNPSSGISVSKYYWIYWVLTVPITALVMFGWYLWYRHANQRWLKQAGLPRMLRDYQVLPRSESETLPQQSVSQASGIISAGTSRIRRLAGSGRRFVGNR